jgi:hypothetical protein
MKHKIDLKGGIGVYHSNSKMNGVNMMNQREDYRDLPPADFLLEGEEYYPPIEEVFERSATVWNLCEGIPFARSRQLECPACMSPEFIYRHWRFFKRPPKQHRTVERCDVHLKCTYCGMVWVHGVVIPPDQAIQVGQIDRRHAKKILHEKELSDR